MLALIFGSDAVRAAAQIQLVHAMATLACATVMNIGGRQARWAPALFLAGSVVFCGAGYAMAAGAPAWAAALRWPGAALLAAGWSILACAAGRTDQAGRLAVVAGASEADAAPARRTAVGR